MNNSSICGNETIKCSFEGLPFEPGLVFDPLLAILYGYHSVTLYKKYEYKLEPVDILELNCLYDRTGVFILATILQLEQFFPSESWVCFLLNFLLLITVWCFHTDFMASQGESFLYVYLNSKYPEKVTNETAIKVTTANKIFVIGMVTIMGFKYSQYFKCQNQLQIETFYRKENLLLLGIPACVAATMNISVSFYILLKLIKKKNKIRPKEQVGPSVKYQVEDDKIFTNVTFKIETVSQLVQNNEDDLKIEDLENDFHQLEDDPDRIDVVQEEAETQETKSDVRRRDSKPDMFYKVSGQPTNTAAVWLPLSLPQSTVETLTTALKINLMTFCTVSMLLSNHFMNFFMYLVDNDCCTKYQANLKLGLSILACLSIITYPFVVKKKLDTFHIVMDKRA